MKIINDKIDLWEEKYRPQTLEDMILPNQILNQFIEYRDKGNIPNILMVSKTPGLGKTSLVTALLHDLNFASMWINASKENSTDVIRNKIEGYASNKSADGKNKVIILDEADNLTTSSQGKAGAQDILRGTIEAYSQNVRFILTANYKNRFIEPLLSRLTIFDFDELFYNENYKKEIGVKALDRMEFILKNEGVEYNKKDVITILKNHYPSLRNMTIALQKNITKGKLILKDVSTKDEFAEIVKNLKTTNYTEIRSRIQKLGAPSTFYSWFFKSMDKYIKPDRYKETIILLADYQDKDARANDKSITLTGFLYQNLENLK